MGASTRWTISVILTWISPPTKTGFTWMNTETFPQICVIHDNDRDFGDLSVRCKCFIHFILICLRLSLSWEPTPHISLLFNDIDVTNSVVIGRKSRPNYRQPSLQPINYTLKGKTVTIFDLLLVFTSWIRSIHPLYAMLC